MSGLIDLIKLVIIFRIIVLFSLGLSILVGFIILIVTKSDFFATISIPIVLLLTAFILTAYVSHKRRNEGKVDIDKIFERESNK